MAIFQSETAKRRRVAPYPYTAGSVVCDKSTFVFSSAFTAATDKVELGVLPAGTELVGYKAVAANLNGNITIGLMSGEFGNPDNARTVGAELYSAQAMASGVHVTEIAAGLNIAPAQVDRGIGLTGSADIAAAGTKSITLFLYYRPAE